MIQFFDQPDLPAVRKNPSRPADPYLFNQVPPTASLRVSVIVPVRNEADHLTTTLDSLRTQQTLEGLPVPGDWYEVLLLTNNCTDASYDIATAYQSRYPDFALHVANIRLPRDQANIGHVRRLLMDEACRRLLTTGNRRGIIASTDGDTVPDSHWIAHTLAEIERGNDAVGGRILTRPGKDHPRKDRSVENQPAELRRYHLLDVTYRQLLARAEARIDPLPNDPCPRHFQHFGASLAVTCDTYLKAGRLPRVPYLEDDAFYQAMLRIDANIRKSPHVKVFTSTRTQGRVAVGFSWQLKQWGDMTTAGQLPLVDDTDTLLTRFRHRQLLRDCWQTMAQTDRRTDLYALAAGLPVDPDWLCRETATNRYFGQLWANVEEQVAAAGLPAPALVPITTAIAELRAFLREE